MKRLNKIPEHFLYTNIFENGGKIYALGYDTDTGEKFYYSSSKMDNLNYFIETNTPTEYTTFVGNKYLKKCSVQSIYDFKKIMSDENNMFTPHGFSNIPTIFINNGIGQEIRSNINFYLNETKRLINIGIFDIETDVGQSFPEPYECRYKITAITIYCTKTKNLYVFADKPLSVDGERILQETIEEEKNKERFKLDADAKLILRTYQNNEEQMIVDFAKVITEIEQIDILTGWNSEGFDIPYIYFRTKKLLGEIGPDIFSPVGISRSSFSDKTSSWNIHINGLSLVDSMEWYKNFTKNMRVLPSYSLNSVCDIEIGAKKAELHRDLKTTYEQFYDDYIKYNMIDVIRLVQLIQAKKFFHTAYVMMYKYYSLNCIERIHSPIAGWENIIYYEALSRNQIFPHREKQNQAATNYPGAYVHKPNPGFYKCLVSFDVNSMYPHIQMGWQISPETFIDDDEFILETFGHHPSLVKLIELRNSAPSSYVDADIQTKWWDENVIIPLINDEFDLSFLKMNKDICMTPSLEFFWMNKNALIPNKLKMIYADRKVITREEDALSIEAEKIKTTDPKKYEELQDQIDFKTLEEIALKIVINAEYGANGSAHYYFYNVRIARSITITGRYLIMGSSIKVNERYAKFLKDEFNADLAFNSRCYNDTDSTYYSFAQLIQELEKCNKRALTNEEKVEILDSFGNEIVQTWINEHFLKATSQLNAENTIVMKREVIALDGIYREIKKHYALLIYDKKGTRYKTPKLYLKGSQFVSISIPTKCKQKYDEILYKFIGASSPESVKNEIIGMINEFREQFKTFNINELCKATAVNNIEKFLDEEGRLLKGAPMQVKAAVAHNRFVQNNGLLQKGATLIQSSERVKLVPIKPGHPYGSEFDTFAFADNLPQGFDKRYIDYEKLFDKNFLKYFKALVKELGLKWKFEENKCVELADDAF